LARNVAIDEAHGGEVLDAGEAHGLQLIEEAVEDAEGVRAIDAGKHRGFLRHRQHLARHLHHDLIGVAIGEDAGERAPARHAVAAGIVDDDEVDAAFLLAFCREARARTPAHDGNAAALHLLELLHQGLAFKAGHVGSPWFC
jgi:hypothetical protein